MEDIPPCPFCGCKIDAADIDFCHPITRILEDGRQLWRAGCVDHSCEAETSGWSAKEAIERWSKRVSIV